MNKQDFEIEIDSTGEVKLHIKGVKGKRCLEFVKIFQEIIGDLKKQELTSEYYEPDTGVHLHTPQQKRERLPE